MKKVTFILIVFWFCTVFLMSGCREASSAVSGTTSEEQQAFAEKRAALVEEGIAGWGIKNPAVLDVIGTVPRHEFVPEGLQNLAYQNIPLPIGYGQTISQPYIVALMTQELETEPGQRVLEIGTGSGYQAVVLAELGCEVYTIEVIPELAEEARGRFDRLGYGRIHTLLADGYFGWPEEAPFDAVLVTAAPDHVPQPLLEQLLPGGIMIIPVGPVGGYQELWKITIDEEGRVQSRSLGGVRFVPLVSEAGGTTTNQLP
jgi:protein-L-isoaspartate(D-aspartate) O-methyltransferase